jgi:hypothetical protein
MTLVRARSLSIALAAAAGCRGSTDDRPVVRDPDFRASYSGSLDRELPHGADLRISASVELADERRQALEAALRRALAGALPCMEGVFGTAPTQIELDATGNVVKAEVTSELLSGTPIADCIEAALRTMQVGPVEGAPITISYPVRNLPSSEQMKEAAELLQRL